MYVSPEDNLLCPKKKVHDQQIICNLKFVNPFYIFCNQQWVYFFITINIAFKKSFDLMEASHLCLINAQAYFEAETVLWGCLGGFSLTKLLLASQISESKGTIVPHMKSTVTVVIES